jgi:hypothetical protein
VPARKRLNPADGPGHQVNLGLEKRTYFLRFERLLYLIK